MSDLKHYANALKAYLEWGKPNLTLICTLRGELIELQHHSFYDHVSNGCNSLIYK